MVAIETWASCARLQEQVRSASTLRIEGSGSRADWRLLSGPVGGVPGLSGLAGVLEFSPSDQVISVAAGSPLPELQRALAEKRQCLPLGLVGEADAATGTVGGAIAMNLPHTLEGRYGSWRDWVLGMKIVLADGRIVKCGSHAVKNVAGYDVQKLMIGSRGTLGAIVEVTLRTSPLIELPTASQPPSRFQAIQRVPRSEVREAQAQLPSGATVDPETGTLWFDLPPELEPKRFPGDWLLRSGCGNRNLELADATQIRLMERAKQIFDPDGKWNPGEMGIF